MEIADNGSVKWEDTNIRIEICISSRGQFSSNIDMGIHEE